MKILGTADKGEHRISGGEGVEITQKFNYDL